MFRYFRLFRHLSSSWFNVIFQSSPSKLYRKPERPAFVERVGDCAEILIGEFSAWFGKLRRVVAE